MLAHVNHHFPATSLYLVYIVPYVWLRHIGRYTVLVCTPLAYTCLGQKHLSGLRNILALWRVRSCREELCCWDKMARRPSAASMTTGPPSPIIVERSNSLQPLSVLGSPGFLSFNNMRLPSRTVSLGALTNPGSSEEAAKVDSEANELFTRNSVAQVKEIQRRLRYNQSANREVGYLRARLPGMTQMLSKKN